MILRKLFLRIGNVLERSLDTGVNVSEKKRNALNESQPLLMRDFKERGMAQA